ncbi:HRDC domain-containing protein [Flavobacterium jejuense]|nr:HRDC domain-containing protein [Flavobacterium jejuense]
MNIRVFNIRLSKEFCIVDQNRMNEFLDTVEVKLTSTNFVTTGTTDYWSAVVFYEPKVQLQKESKDKLCFEDLTDKEKEIFLALKEWRNDFASNLGWSAFRVCHNSHLMNIAKNKPETIDELLNIKSFGVIKTEKYGEEIISVLNAF